MDAAFVERPTSPPLASGIYLLKEQHKFMESIEAAIGVVPRRDSRAADRVPEAAEPDISQDNERESIARLAYALWQLRGCPLGSSEEDWAEAEKQLGPPQARRPQPGGRERKIPETPVYLFFTVATGDSSCNQPGCNCNHSHLTPDL